MLYSQQLNIKSTSKLEARLLSAVEGLPVFTPSDVARLLGLNRDGITQLLSRAARKGHVVRVERGRYTLPSVEVLAVASNLAHPAYVSFWTGLVRHGLTLQMPQTVQVAVARQRPNLTFGGVSVRFVTLGPQRCFGYQRQADGAFMAVAEKALVDALYLPRLAGGLTEVHESLGRGLTEGKLEPDRLAEYALQMGSASLCRRLGYLLELEAALPVKSLVEELERAGRGFARLDPAAAGWSPSSRPRAARGRWDRRWRLFINRELRAGAGL